MDGLAAGARGIALGRFYGKQRTAFGEAISNHIRKADFLKIALYLPAKGSPADDEGIHPAAEEVHHLLSQRFIVGQANVGHGADGLGRAGRKVRLNPVGVDFFHNERHRDNQVRPDFLHRLHQEGRRGRLSQEVDGETGAAGIYEFHGQAVDVGQRQHGNNGFGTVVDMFLAILHNVRHGAVGEHYTLRVSGSAGGVVDDGQGFHLVGVRDLLGVEAARFPLLPGFLQGFIGLPEELFSLYVNHSPKLRKRLLAQLGPEFRICKQEDAV